MFDLFKKKAFDKDVIHLMYNREIPLNKRTAYEALDVGNGIRPGDSLSPMLFNFIMDEVVRSINKEGEYRMGNKDIKIIFYGDEAILTG